MSELDRLVSTLKQRLKAQGITYRELGTRLGLSEASVKRMFASRRFSLDRLLEISHLLGFSLAELAQEAALSGTRLHTLGEGQERELVSDEKLLLVAVCVLNHWTMDEILHTYRLSEAECIQRLARLDRLRLLDLLPGNRVRLNVARDFDWLPGGPIRNFFRRQGWWISSAVTSPARTRSWPFPTACSPSRRWPSCRRRFARCAGASPNCTRKVWPRP